MPQVSLAELAKEINLEYTGNGDSIITGAATIDQANSSQITFLDNPKYKKWLATCQAGAIVLLPKYADESPIPCILAPEPYVAFAKVLTFLHPSPAVKPGIHPSASIAATATVAASAQIAANVTIGEYAQIGERVVIGPCCVVGDNVTIGDDSLLYANVTLYHDVTVGQRCMLHSGAVIGADGFGFANERGTWLRVPQIGSVILGDDVDVGANTCIDRGAINNTIIENGVKIDNLVQIAHNVQIGHGTAIAGCTGIAGSTKIGKYCLIGGGCGILGHVTIADNAMLAAGTQVGQDLPQGVYGSNITSMPIADWRRMQVHVRNLDKFSKRLHALEKPHKHAPEES